MDSLLSVGVRMLCYFIVLYGIWMMVRPIYEPIFKQTGKRIDHQARFRIRQLGQHVTKNKKRIALYQHIDRMLLLTDKHYEPGVSAIRFMTKTAVIFLICLTIGLLTVGDVPDTMTFDNPFTGGVSVQKTGDQSLWEFIVIFAFIFAVIPYLRLVYRFQSRSVQASYDLLEVIKLMAKYTNLATDAVLKRTADILPDTNVLRRPLKILSISFTEYENELELERKVRQFTDVIGTTFATSFSQDLMYIHREGGQNLRNSLLYLSSAMEKQRDIIMQVKADNQDAIQLGTYGNALILIGICGTLAYLISWPVYWRLQFQTQAGLGFLTFIVITIVIAFIISRLLSRPKLDYK